jgi:glycosyltransferase involved in cell wall biosynthesis
MTAINLSYVLTTYNKLRYLEVTIPLLIKNIQPDEEIIIVDGGSTDGSFNYLNKLSKAGKIHHFISEKDFGESHGFNKGTFLSTGKLIKYLSDDDVYDFEIIRKCKKFMLANPKFDALIANVCNLNLKIIEPEINFIKTYEVWFKEWIEEKTPNCFFCCLPLLVKKESIAHLGLFDSSFKHADFEYSVRITTQKAKIAFYTDIMVTAVQNASSISQNYGSIVGREVERVSKYYNYNYPVGPIKQTTLYSQTLFEKFFTKIRLGNYNNSNQQCYPDYNYKLKERITYTRLDNLFEEVLLIMCEFNKSNKGEFITN